MQLGEPLHEAESGTDGYDTTIAFPADFTSENPYDDTQELSTFSFLPKSMKETGDSTETAFGTMTLDTPRDLPEYTARDPSGGPEASPRTQRKLQDEAASRARSTNGHFYAFGSGLTGRGFSAAAFEAPDSFDEPTILAAASVGSTTHRMKFTSVDDDGGFRSRACLTFASPSTLNHILLNSRVELCFVLPPQ